MSDNDGSKKAALVAAAAANELKATDILVQNVGPFIGVTDYFVFATAGNPRQGEAMIDRIEEDMRVKAGMKPMNREISKDGSWSLIDYGDVVVHVFSPEARNYYRLEQLWSEAPMIDLSAIEGFEDMELTSRGEALLESSPNDEV